MGRGVPPGQGKARVVSYKRRRKTYSQRHGLNEATRSQMKLALPGRMADSFRV